MRCELGRCGRPAIRGLWSRMQCGSPASTRNVPKDCCARSTKPAARPSRRSTIRSGSLLARSRWSMTTRCSPSSTIPLTDSKPPSRSARPPRSAWRCRLRSSCSSCWAGRRTRHAAVWSTSCDVLIQTGSRGSALESLRHDTHACALFDIPPCSWRTLLRALLGNTSATTSWAGCGVLVRLLIGETIPALLADDDLVLTLSVSAPQLAG